MDKDKEEIDEIIEKAITGRIPMPIEYGAYLCNMYINYEPIPFYTRGDDSIYYVEIQAPSFFAAAYSIAHKDREVMEIEHPKNDELDGVIIVVTSYWLHYGDLEQTRYFKVL